MLLHLLHLYFTQVGNTIVHFELTSCLPSNLSGIQMQKSAEETDHRERHTKTSKQLQVLLECIFNIPASP